MYVLLNIVALLQ